MADCSCLPNMFPFQCERHGLTDYKGWETCRGKHGLLEKIQQEKKSLKRLRSENECKHLGVPCHLPHEEPVRSCELYGKCTVTFRSVDVQSCDMCSDHTAVVHLLELPTEMKTQFVPFDTGKGSGSGSDNTCNTDCQIGCCHGSGGSPDCEMVDPGECDGEFDVQFDPIYTCAQIDCTDVACCESSELLWCGGSGKSVTECVVGFGGIVVFPDPDLPCNPGDPCPDCACSGDS